MPPITATLRCTYPGTDWGEDIIRIQPHPSFGGTPAEVHRRLTCLIRSTEEFEVPLVDGPPFLFSSETIRQVVVR